MSASKQIRKPKAGITSVNLLAEDHKYLTLISNKTGDKSVSSIIRRAIRELARKEGVAA